VYGFAEGWLTARKLRKALRKADYAIETPSEADIIIAHSGGYLVFPNQTKAHTILYIGANTWDRSLSTSLKQKLHFDYSAARAKNQLIRWLLHGLRNDLYILKPRHTFQLVRGYRKKPSQPPISARTIVVRNQHDSYCTERALLSWRNIDTFVAFEGGHDDVWNNPENYVNLLKNVQHG
jgi:hypothetical protein